ncbi:MAG: tRNA (adenosine(37)-N6)-threonylcarbamoyltransferase complex dimerization subunit type 1 TsaB [Clostridia bacterium]|nr:tRNA (adenosine(37)-N6)-threonylcarbamoyltransferase complex dimerization subunit type 1 TsaB [Clostridia bacterium]
MNILAIDSTTKKAAVALMLNDTTYVKERDNEITHSEKLLPLVDEVLNEHNVKVKDMDLLACTLGPGSFTGVRIGIATVKALAKVLNKKILGVTSLKLMALNHLDTEHKYILSTLDAKNTRVYYELFEVKDNKELKETSISGNLPYEALISLLKEKGIADILVVTDNKEMLENSFTEQITGTEVISSTLNLRNIFKEDVTNKNTYTYETLDAMYFRNSEAERTRDGEK